MPWAVGARSVRDRRVGGSSPKAGKTWNVFWPLPPTTTALPLSKALNPQMPTPLLQTLFFQRFWGAIDPCRSRAQPA